MRIFGCKAYVHVPKDERSKLDAKSRPCIFVGYGQDKFGYRLYDPVAKKLVRSRDVVFLENQTLNDIEKTNSHIHDDLTDFEPIPISQLLTRVDGGADMQHDAIDNDQYDGDTYNPMDADDDQLSHSMVNPQETTLRRSTRVRQQSTRYSPNEYVFLTDGGEPEDFKEAMENADK